MTEQDTPAARDESIHPGVVDGRRKYPLKKTSRPPLTRGDGTTRKRLERKRRLLKARMDDYERSLKDTRPGKKGGIRWRKPGSMKGRF